MFTIEDSSSCLFAFVHYTFCRSRKKKSLEYPQCPNRITHSSIIEDGNSEAFLAKGSKTANLIQKPLTYKYEKLLETLIKPLRKMASWGRSCLCSANSAINDRYLFLAWQLPPPSQEPKTTQKPTNSITSSANSTSRLNICWTKVHIDFLLY